MLYFNWFANSFITDRVGAAFAGQAFIEQYARVETAEGTRTDTSSKPVSATG